MGIGPDFDVDAERIIFLFDDVACVYPAQSFDNFKWDVSRYEKEWTEEPFYT